MALRVEDPLVEWQHLVGGEGQVQVLQSGREKVRWLIIEFFRRYICISNSRIAITLGLAVLLDGLCQLPCVLAVLRVTGQSPQHQVGLGQFGTVSGKVWESENQFKYICNAKYEL